MSVMQYNKKNKRRKVLKSFVISLFLCTFATNKGFVMLESSYYKGVAQFGSNTMPYRGLGSGIPRVMATGSDVELIDRPDGNQFVARIWRTTLKDEVTTQKANEELISTTQKEEGATQKSKTTTQKPLNATQKRILDYLKSYPKATRKETADALGDITEDGVKFNLGLLQQYGRLKRKGGRKNGEWVVVEIDG